MAPRTIIKRALPFVYKAFVQYKLYTSDTTLVGEEQYFGPQHPDKVFLVIKLADPHLGLMAIYHAVLGYLRIASAKGYVPVVDLKNYHNGYLDPEAIGTTNAWEYYFEQPSAHTLDEVYQSQHVRLASGIAPVEAHPITLHLLLQNPKKRTRYSTLIREQLRISQSVQQTIDAIHTQVIGAKRAVGVVSRGSDLLNFPGHARQPTLNELITKTQAMMAEWQCDYVFLATEETAVVSRFRAIFGNKLLLNDAFRVSTIVGHVPLVDVSANRPNDRYLRGLEYLTTVQLLARCTCLTGSLVGGTLGAIGMNQGQYEHIYLYELGAYD